MALIVDVTSDFVCPWCYIAKRRLERAVSLLPDPNSVQVRWHPFLVNPHMPKEGMCRRAYRVEKFGRERAAVLVSKVIRAGALEGLAFNYETLDLTPNSLDAHRVIWLAGELGVQDAVVEAIFHAYYIETRDLTQTDVLFDVVTKAGLDPARTAAMLTSDEAVGLIAAADLQARRSGIRGVPHFSINGMFGFVGARDPHYMLAALQRGNAAPPTPPIGPRQVDELDDMSDLGD